MPLSPSLIPFIRSSAQQQLWEQVWNVVKAMTPSQGPGLSRSQFSAALRLVALAQEGVDLSDDNCEAALDPMTCPLRFGGLLPPPVLQQVAAPARYCTALHLPNPS